MYTLDDEEWHNLHDDIRDLFRKFLSIHGFGLAKTTKILHLKRPEVFPVLDSLVVNFLLGTQLGFDKNRDIELGLKALDKMWNIILDNLDEFVMLKNSLSDLPIPLTIARLFDILCWSAEKWDIQGKLRAPKGIPSVSLLKTKSGRQSKRVARDTKSRTRGATYHIVTQFIDELRSRAKYDIQGEKPIAMISALKYVHDNGLTGTKLIDLFDEPHSNHVRNNFITLANRYSRLASSSDSWSVITGNNQEIQNAILKNGQVNDAFTSLTNTEIESILTRYMKILTA